MKNIRRLLRRLSLERLLVGLNAGLVVFAVTLIAFVSANRLRSLAEEQAQAHVGLAGATALQAVNRSEDEVLTAARLLAERPTLKRILESGDSRATVAFLEQFIATSHLSGGAIFLNGELFASVGATIPWPKLLSEQAPQGGRILSRPQAGPLVLAASTPLRGNENAVVVVGRVVDGEFVSEIKKFAGLDCSIRSVEEALAVEGPAQHVRRHAVEWEEQVIELIPQEKRFLAVLPLRNPSGKIVGVVESSLPEDAMTGPLHRFVTSLAILAFAVALFGAAASAALARRLVKPLERLRLATERIGRGDFDTPIPRAPGREIGILAATLEDMRAKLLNLTAELRRKQSEAEAVLLGIAEGVYSVDSERRIRYLNPQAAALLGVNAQSAIGRFCGDVLHPRLENGRRPCEDRCPIVHARFRGSATATEQLETAHGPKTVVITSGSASADAPREADGWMGKAQQFQIIRAETDLESARRMRDGVLANISHEFRTPLSAQLASLELLRDRLPDMEVSEARELLLSVERGTLRLTGLIDNLLESVRIDAGMDSIRKQTVALDEIVEEAVDLAAPLIAIREQALDVNLPYPMQPVQGDHSRLVQVFVNLLGNANKFAPAGSTIRIGGETQENEITLWVEDEGEGIAPGETDAVFERFTRSTGEEPAESGMGLGLWIVKSIVERHGGRVAAEVSDHPGARIRVTLPIGVANLGTERKAS